MLGEMVGIELEGKKRESCYDKKSSYNEFPNHLDSLKHFLSLDFILYENIYSPKTSICLL
jgi:hypothetical protein